MKNINSRVFLTLSLLLIARPASLTAEVLFQDTFNSGSVTDPASRATGTLATTIKYAFSNITSGEVDIVSGVLDWTGTNLQNGNLELDNGTQNWTFVDSMGVDYDWSPHLAGNVYDIQFTWHTAWSHPLTFCFSDDPQEGTWNPFGGGYDFGFGSFGHDWRSGEDTNLQIVFNVGAGNAVSDIRIRVNEGTGIVDVYVDGDFMVSRLIDFENPGRYFSFGEPTEFGGYVDDFTVTLVDTSIATQTYVALASGDWSEPGTWVGNAVPGAIFDSHESEIQIPAGITVTLDTDVEVGTVIVNGTLTAASTTVSIIADSVVVEGASASFELGTANSRYTGDFTLTLKGEPTETYTPAGHGHDLGARALLAQMGGTLNLHGADRLEWTQLAATADVGATSIVVAGLVDWQDGDEIIITPSKSAIDEFDRIVVGSTTYDALNDTTTVTFQAGESLVYWHLGEIQQQTRPAGVNPERTWTADLRAEVALLNRNITIQSRVDNHSIAGFGGHLMIHGPMDHMGMTMPAAEAYIQSVALKSMGQKGLNGRYPFHWHMVLDSSKGGTIQQYLKDSVIDQSFNRAITIHGTDYVLVDNNVAYDHIGHGVFLEDGSERFNVITNNVMLGGSRPLPGEELLQSEILLTFQNRGPAAYWISNPNNTIENNVAAGTVGTGYWYAFPKTPLGLSGMESYYSGLEPFKEPLGSFIGNTAHSLGNGFDIFDQVTDTNLPNDLMVNLGWDNDQLHIFQDFTAYACDEGIYCGIGVGGPDSNNIFDNAILVDNKFSLFLAANIEIRNSLFQADSGYQMSNENNFYFFYDGPGRIIDSHLVGFNESSASFVTAEGGATVYPHVYLEGITTDHVEPLIFDRPDIDLHMDPKRYSNIFYDVDGLITQTISAKSIVPDHPFLTTGNEVRPATWNNYVYNTHRYMNFYVYAQPVGLGSASVIRSKEGTPDAYSYGVPQDHHHQFPVIINDDFLYTFQIETLPPMRSLFLRNLTHNLDSFAFTVCYKNFGMLPGVQVKNTNLQVAPVAVNSIAEVNAATTTVYYIELNGDIYIRHVAEGDMKIEWASDPVSWPAMDSDGDTLTDTTEVGIGLDPLVSDQARMETFIIDGGSNEFVMQINENLYLQDAFVIETSNNLINWDPMAPTFLEIDPDIGGNGTNRLIEARIPMVNDHTFFRLSYD